MKTLSEDQVKEELGIDNFKAPLKEKTIQLVSAIHNMSDKATEAVVEQFGNFKALGAQVIEKVNGAFHKSIDSTNQLTNKVIDERHKLIDFFENQYQESKNEEERKTLADVIQRLDDKNINEVADQREHEQLLMKLASFVALSVVAAAAGILGVNLDLNDLIKKG